MNADIHLNCIKKKLHNSVLVENTFHLPAKTNWLVLCGEIVGPYSEYHKNTHKYTVWAKCGVINVAERGTVGLAIVNLKN
jgi:hypothetical protein